VRIFKVAEILRLCRIRRPDLPRFDRQLCLPQPPATEELFIYEFMSVLTGPNSLALDD
jgi:hypothetical protein